MKSAFGEFVEASHIKKRDLAVLLGVTPSYISKLCRGDKIPDRVMDVLGREGYDISSLAASAKERETLAASLTRIADSLERIASILEHGKI